MRSQSGSKKGSGSKEEVDPMKPFTQSSPPWKATTPRTKLRTDGPKKEEQKEKDTEQKVIPRVRQVMKEESAGGASSNGKDEVNLAAQTMAKRQALGEACAEEMKQALERLSELQPKPKLSHAHLSKMDKLRKTTTNLKRRIHGLDQSWIAFKKVVEDRVTTQMES